MILPNFLIIGAQKAGTTSLSSYVSQHPQIYLDGDEPHFFAFEEGIPPLHGPCASNTAFWQTRATTLNAYMQRFESVTDEKAIGETSPYYLFYEGTAERIRQRIPNVTLIAILRHPVERAFSNFWHCVRLGFEPLTDFAQAIAAEEQERNDWGIVWQYKQKGLYYQQLKRYYELFDWTQIHIFLNEELAREPEKLFRSLFEVLGVETGFTPDVSSKQNANPGVIRNRTVKNILSKQHPFNGLSKYVLPHHIRCRIVNALRTHNLKQPSIAPQVRRELLEYYREDTLKLQDVIQRDLSDWLK